MAKLKFLIIALLVLQILSASSKNTLIYTNTPQCHYTLLPKQPGLKRMFYSIYKANDESDFRPLLMQVEVTGRDYYEVDTFKYNWISDTIICENGRRRDHRSLAYSYMLSSRDTIYYSYEVLFRDKPMPPHKANFIQLLKNWNKKELLKYSRPSIVDGSIYFYSRYIIQNGRIIKYNILELENPEI